MTENKQQLVPAKSHLKIALAFFIGWLICAYQLIINIKMLGGITGLIQEFKAGSYANVLLLALSICFLTIALKYLHLYFLYRQNK